MNASQTDSAVRYLFPKRYADFVQRLRVTAGFLMLGALAWLARPSLRSMITGLSVSLLGLLLRGWAAGHLAKDRELAMSGPYAYLRNPLYAGSAMAACGIAIAAASIWLAVVFTVVFLLIYLPAIELEEQHLREIFPDYAFYAQQVKRFLPARKYPARGASFSWALYKRNEEYKAAFGWLIAVAWLCWRCKLL